MPAPIIPILLGLGLIVLASKPKTASAAPVTPPRKVTPPATPPPYWSPFPGGTPSGGWLPGCPPPGTPDSEIASLPPQVAVPVNLALATSTDPVALDTLASQLEACGLKTAGAAVRKRASDLRGAATPPANSNTATDVEKEKTKVGTVSESDQGYAVGLTAGRNARSDDLSSVPISYDPSGSTDNHLRAARNTIESSGRSDAWLAGARSGLSNGYAGG